ncbi:MAG: ArnT family glycosyltransferase, partial [Anaerolineae bacterium]
AIVRFTSQPLWWLLAPLLLLQPLILSVRERRPRLLAESWAPLLIPYLVLLPRMVLAVSVYLHGTHVWPLIPPPLDEALNLEVALILATLWALVAQSGPMTQAFGRRAGWRRTLGYTLAAVALIWATSTYFSLHTHGATGTDPYAYVQMAVDIANRALPLHTFNQVPRVAELSLPLEGAVPLGHFVLDPETGLSATVWPPGHSALLAAGYLLVGEVGLYLVNPLLGLLTLVATWHLCTEVLHDWPQDRRVLAAGVAVFILATSYEQVDRLLVPMADVSSQLFSTLTIYFALRATRERASGRLFAVLSGLALGFAFNARYTQVLMAAAVAFLFIVAYRDEGWKRTVTVLAYAAGAAWIAALPVLAYHWIAFGHPFSVGSTELEAFGWASLPVTTVRMLEAFFSPNEFLYVAPFLAWGFWRLWRTSRRTTGALHLWLGIITCFHLFYLALRLRDLLSVFPVLALWVGAGLADILGRAEGIRRPRRRQVAQALSFLLVITLLRTGATLLLAFPPMHFNTFGYLLGDQRRAFDTLATLVPPEATVAASLNSGAVALYADRDIVRPEEWSPEQWVGYVEDMLAAEEPIFVLVDGRRMEAPLDALRGRYRLNHVGSLPMPYFYPDGGSLNREIPLYEVGRKG